MRKHVSKTGRITRGQMFVRFAIGAVALTALTLTTGASDSSNEFIESAPALTQIDTYDTAKTALLVPRRIRLIIGYRKTRTA